MAEDNIVLSCRKSKEAFDRLIYTLTAEGIETIYPSSGKRKGVSSQIDMHEFWKKHGETFRTIVDNKKDGWDQVRIHHEVSCRAIHDFVLRDKDGRERKFGIYGAPRTGCIMDDGQPLPREYIKLHRLISKDDGSSDSE
jgi:hypothetical protein